MRLVRVEALGGVLPALVTPMTEDGLVDQPAVGRLVERMLNGGVHGLVALGSTGEVARLGEVERQTLLTTVVESAAGRVPIICGVVQAQLAAAQSDVGAAASAGADAVLVAPPYYYPSDQATLVAFYREVASRSELPLFLYNIPQYTKIVAEPATVALLAQEGSIAGIKDSGRDFEYFQMVCRATQHLPHFRIFAGNERTFLSSLRVGASGTICGAANVAPELVVRIYRAWRRSDLNSAWDDQDALVDLMPLFSVGEFPAAFKAALAMQGICQPWPVKPVAALDASATADLRLRLDALGLLSDTDHLDAIEGAT